mmetsp:Transcript_78823/g.139138  ORF Transcript_78823/g.139138 Transcript_78823/m.139138 type:complete len:669 (+) Transcript_78823:43-2049(+)
MDPDDDDDEDEDPRFVEEDVKEDAEEEAEAAEPQAAPAADGDGEEAEADDEIPPGWPSAGDRTTFLHKFRREERDNEREERFEALEEFKALALQPQNCVHFWKDDEVRAALVDALKPPNVDRGKSIYVDDGPPDNDPQIRAVMAGLLAHMTTDQDARALIGQDTPLREIIIQTMQHVELPVEKEEGAEEEEEEDDEDKPKTGPDPAKPAPFFVQSRMHALLGLLVQEGAVSKATARPPLPEDEEYGIEEGEEEEEKEDDPEVDVETEDDGKEDMFSKARKRKEKKEAAQKEKEETEKRLMEEMERKLAEEEEERKRLEADVPDSDVSSSKGSKELSKEDAAAGVEKDEDEDEEDEEDKELDLEDEKEESSEEDESEDIDPDALLAEVEDILYEKKPSSDEDLLEALCLVTAPQNSEEELMQLPPWRPGAARTRRLEVVWTFAATSNNMDNNGLWRFEKLQTVLLDATEVSQPDNMRVSALGALNALLARDENKRPMFEDERVVKTFALAAAAAVPVPVANIGDGSTDVASELRPQSVVLRRQGLTGIGLLAECVDEGDEVRRKLWENRRISASLIDAAGKEGPLRPLALRALRELSKTDANHQHMLEAEIPELMGKALEDTSMDRRQLRYCELGRDRLVNGEYARSLQKEKEAPRRTGRGAGRGRGRK